MSVKGVTGCVLKQHKRKAESMVHVNVDALPTLADAQEYKQRKKDSERRKPQPPVSGAEGSGGRIGSGNTTNILMKELGMTKDTSREEDPREAFLRHNDGAAANPYWIAPVYAKNQPVTLLADTVESDSEEEEN
jgi:hypothetical protein